MNQEKTLIQYPQNLSKTKSSYDIQDFLGTKLPDHIRENFCDQHIMHKVNQKQIMEAIDFAPPFLRIDKMLIFKGESNFIGSRSIGTGILTQEDTEGHYNNTIFLAVCGRLMGESASAHIGLLFPNTAPQVVKVDHIKPITSSDQTIWKPNKKGSSFLIETVIVRRKLHVIKVNSRISFGNLVFGIADNATIILTPKESIYTAKELPIDY